jgi:hypothetical protein
MPRTWRADLYNHGHAETDQIGREVWKSTEVTLYPAFIYLHVAIFDVALLGEALEEWRLAGSQWADAEKSNHGHGRLLCPHWLREANHRADARNELPPSHCNPSQWSRSVARSRLQGNRVTLRICGAALGRLWPRPCENEN